jgi:ribosomal protein S13
MYLIQRDLDTDTGVAEVEAPASEATETPTVPTEAETPTEEQEEPYFNLPEDEQTSELPNGAGALPNTSQSVNESEYAKVVAELQATKTELQSLKAATSNPMVQATLEVAMAMEKGVDINPADFIRAKFGVDATNLSDEAVVKEMVIRDAAQVGVKPTEEQIQNTIERRLEALDQMDDIARLRQIQQYRNELREDSQKKVQAMVSAKVAEEEKAAEFWRTANQNLSGKLTEYVEAGVKDYGLIDKQFTKDKAAQIQMVIDNGYVKYKKDGSVDVEFQIELAAIALDLRGYHKRIEDAAYQRYLRDSLKQKSAGSLANPSGGAPTSFVATTENPKTGDEYSPSKATPINVAPKRN